MTTVMRPFACFLFFARGMLVAQSPATFHSDVALVHVDLEVTDGTRIVTGLHKEDFIIHDNSQPQPILYCSEEEEPLDVILLFDISNSMRPSVQQVGASAHAALAELRPGDRVAVMTFEIYSHLIAPLSSDLAQVQRSIEEDVVEGRFHGGTHLLAGVDDAAKYFLAQPASHRRRAVLILTDNFGQRSRRTSTVVHHLWEADATLSGLIIRTAASTALNTAAMISNPAVGLLLQEGMQGVAEKTGGDTLRASQPGEDFREMIHRLRLRYSLDYALPRVKPGQQRQVKVELSKAALDRYPTARLRSRKGYLAPAKT
jgi:VWFA-related protein